MLRKHRRRPSIELMESRRLPASITVAPINATQSDVASEAVFTATLDAASASAITLTYSTANGTAKAGRDYVATSSSVVIPAGATSATFSVPIVASDVANKPVEKLIVNLQVSSGNTVNSRVGAFIYDGNAQPTVTATDVVVPATAAGKATRTEVKVSLSGPSYTPVTVDYSTADDTATSTGTSRTYASTAGQAVIRAGATTTYIPVTSYASSTTDQTFRVVLRDATGASLSTALPGGVYGRVVVDANTTATATKPTLSVASATAIAGGNETFTVTLSAASTSPVSVRYYTADGTASTPSYTAVNDVLTIPAGSTSATITVPTSAASTATGDQSFFLYLDAPANATLASSFTIGTITQPPALAISALGELATSTGSNDVYFLVTLSSASTTPVTVNYGTFDGTAVAGTDYTTTTGTLTFAPGATTQFVTVPLIASTSTTTGMGGMGGPTGSLGLIIGDPSGATVTPTTAIAVFTGGAPGGGGGTPPTGTPPTGTPPEGGGPTATEPTATVAGSTAVVGTSGTGTLTFTVSLSSASASTVTIDYATADNSAVAGTDYTATSGTLTFAPGVTSLTVSVPVTGETTTSAQKTLSLVISDATNALITSNSISGVILYASGTPALSVDSPSLTDGTSGTSTLTFTVSLSAVSTEPVTVNYATADGTALAGTDYTAASGTLTFAAGVTSLTVPVTITGEASTAMSKTFTLNLTGATNTSNATATTTGTINYLVSGSSTDLSDNLSDTSGGTETATGTDYVAASFTTGTSAFTLNSVALELAATTAGAATVSIYSDGGLQPGTLLETLTNPSTIPTALTADSFTSTGLALAANTTYWIVLAAPSGTYDWSWTADDTGSGTGFTDTWASSTDGGSTWFAYDSSPTQFNVTATVTG